MSVNEVGSVLRGTDVPLPRPLVDQMTEAAASTPSSAAAIRDGDRRIGHEACLERASRLAARLIESGDVEGTTLVLAVSPGIDFAVGLVAGLMAGMFVSPLHPELPAARVRRILEVASPRIIIAPSAGAPAGASLEALQSAAQILPADAGSSRPVTRPTSLDDPCYCLFTSGSTGVPKGVRMHQLPVANLARFDVQRAPGPWRVAQLAPLGFDVAIQEFFGTFGGGGELVTVPLRVRRDITRLVRFLADERIERLHCVPLLARFIARASNALDLPLPHLRELIVGGETLRVDDDLRRFAERSGGFNLLNQLGAAETIQTTCGDLGDDPRAWSDLPELGSPIPGVVIRIVDDEGAIVSRGVEGDIEVGGYAPALGYGDGDGSRFREDAEGRWYNTRDRGVIHPGGRFEYRGRLDHQVKINGYRVELGEVEACVSGLPYVEDAAAATITGVENERVLVCMVVPRPGEDLVDASRVMADLRRRTPEWMVPRRVEVVDRLPENGNGKVDRREVTRRFEVPG